MRIIKTGRIKRLEVIVPKGKIRNKNKILIRNSQNKRQLKGGIILKCI
jgi:hypothetical protein